jgi:outer membrane protein
MFRTFIVLILTYPFIFTFSQTDTITVEKCIEIALKKNPQIKLAEANMNYYSSSSTVIRSSLFPQIYFQSNYAKNGGTFFFGPTARAANYENYTLGFQMQQLIFDFGRTYSRVSAGSDLSEASKQDYVTAKENLILSVNVAYINYLQAKRLRSIAVEIVNQTNEHLKQAEGFYKAGTSPQFDVMKAKTDNENANLNLIKADNNVKITRIQLENLLNERFPEGITFKDNLEFEQQNIDLKIAKEDAETTRPELISGRYKIEANKSLLTSAWTANLPSINASASYQWRAYELQQKFQNSWNVGLSFSLPLFLGFSLDAGIDQARANLKVSESTYELLQQSVSLEIEQNYFNVIEAHESIESSKRLVDQAQEAYRLADARYREGIGSPIEISDAQVTLLNAKNFYVQSLYDYQLALIKLKRAIGTL